MTLEKRILSVLLTVIMVFSMVPLSVSAADGNVAEVTVGNTTTPYDDIVKAFSAAQYASGSVTVKLLDDIDNFATGFSRTDGVQFQSGDVTLDLNGHYIERYNNAAGTNANKKAVFYVTGSAKMTVKDSVGGGEIMQPLSEPALIVDSGASLTVLSGTVTNTGAGCGIRIDGGTLAVGGGKVTASYDAGICVVGGTVTVTGDAKIHGGKSSALLITGESSVTLSGGTYTTNETNKRSILTNIGKVTDLLAEGFRFTDSNGLDIAITEDGKATDSDNVTVSDFGIKYIDADGAEQKCTSFTEITEASVSSALSTGWYAVSKTVNIGLNTGYLGVVGGATVNLILCDGATLNLQNTLYMLGGSTLNIYGQSGGTGTLIAKVTSGTMQPGIGIMHNTPTGRVNVNIYGGTITAQAESGAQAIGINPTLMPSGKVTVTVAKGMKCVKTDDRNTAYAYDNTDGTSITITKCTDHKWSYSNITDDAHDQTCDLCGTTETGVAHTTASYKYIRTDIHRLICACGKDYSTEYHTYTYAPNSDGLTHTATCKCEYVVDDIAHTYKGEDKICICGAVHSATYDGKNYASLQSAIDAAAAVGGTVTLAQQVNENVVVTDGTVTIDLGGNRWSADISYSKKGYVPLTVNGGSVTLKNGNLFQGSSTSTYETGIVINGGSVTVEEDARVMGGVPDRNTKCPSVTLNGGTLVLKEGAALLSGLQVPEGRTLADYLPEGTAFVKCSYDNNSNTVTVSDPQEFVPDVYTANKLTESMVIVSHTHDFSGGTACPCGFNCDHSTVDSATGKCETCDAQVYAATLTKVDGTVTGYKAFADAWTAAIENEVSTLKLLCDVDLGKVGANEALSAASGTFTLDLNEFTLSADSNKGVINVSGSAKLTVKNGKLANTAAKGDAARSTAITLIYGYAELENVELTGGSEYGEQGYSAVLGAGTLHITDSTFNGALRVYPDLLAKMELKITSATLNNGIEYKYDGNSNKDYDGLKGFFADGCMLFDENGKYIDLTSDAYWSVGTRYTTFNYADKAVVKSHEHTFVDGKCAECDYVCLHDSGKNDRDAGYFEKAVCSVCHCEYGDYAKDTTAPTGEIKIKERTWWQSLLNTVSFGIFYKEEITATITADDDSYTQSGYDAARHSVKIEYFISTEALSEEAVKKSGFNAYDGSFGISDDDRYVIYVKLTDHAGNVAYASTDGFVIDTTAPRIEGMENGGVYYICGGKTITAADKNIDKVTMDGTEISLDENGQYNLPVDSEKHKIVAADKAGNETTVWITVYPSHDFDKTTDSCINCGTPAAAKVENGDISDRFATGDELFAALEDEKYDGATVTLLKDAEYTERVSLKHDLTIDMNGKSLRTSGRSGFGISSGEVTIRSSVGTADIGAMFGVNSNAHLVMGEGIGKVETIVVMGKLTVYSGSYDYVYTILPKTKSDDITLYGGTYGKLELTVLGARDVLAKGYRFRDLLYADAGDKILNNVTVIPCDHADLSNFVCNGCGMEIFLSVENNEETKLFGTFEDAIRYAEQNEGCTVKLLQDLTIDSATAGSLLDGYSLVLGEGEYTLELNGKTLNINNNYFNVYHGCKLAIGDFVGGGKVTDPGMGRIAADDKSKLTVTGGEFNTNIQISKRSSLVLKGGSFESIRAKREAGCTPFGFIADGYTFANSDGSGYAGESKVVYEVGDKYIEDVIVVLAPVYIPAGTQPQDKTFYLTSPDAEKLMSVWMSCRDLDTDKKITLTLEKTDGTAIISSEHDYDKNAAFSSSLNLKGLAESSEQYRIKIEFDGYVLYSDTFRITVAECEHPGYDRDNKCTQCGCELAAAIVGNGKTTGYVNFADALAAAQTEENRHCGLYLFGDVSGKITVSTGDFYLYMNGHTVGAINVTDTGMLDIRGGGTVTGSVTVAKNYFAFLNAIDVTFKEDVNADGSNGMFVGCTFAGSLNIGGNYIEVNNCTLNGDLNVSGSGVKVNYGSISGKITVNSGGVLHFLGDGGKYGAALVKAGGTMRVYANSTFSDEVAVENDGTLVLDDGTFKKITAAGRLIDCLGYDRAFEDVNNGKIIDGRNPDAGDVKVVRHTHTCAWNTDTHEKLCDCGYVEATDTEAPVISGIENYGTYYGPAEFSVTDKNDFTVTVDGTEVNLTLGSYILEPDNEQHIITAADVAGNVSSVAVRVNKLYKVTLSSGVGYTIKGEPLAGYGTDYTFTLEIADGYSKTDSFMVDVNGRPMQSDSGSYTVSNVTSNIFVTVFGVADITAPDAEVNIHGNTFKDFINRITFGLFFKQTQTVQVTAEDEGSGVGKVEYLLSETAFTSKDAITGNWTELTLNGGKASFGIEPDRKAFVYVRVTDNSGNITVVNSDGVVVYTDAEAIAGIKIFIMGLESDIGYHLNMNGNTVSEVYNGTEKLNDTDYYVSWDGSFTLKNSYLSTLAAGEYTISLMFRPMGENYVDNNGNDAPSEVFLKLTVVKKTPILDHKSSDGKIYDGNPIGTPTFNTDSDGALTFEYKRADEDDTAYTAVAPKNVGNYIIRITTAETDTFKAASSTMEFDIQPKEVTISDVKVADKIYDGTADASITSFGTVNVLARGDDVKIEPGEAAFDNKNVGSGKTVTFSGFSLSGDDALNYTLVSQPSAVTADITAREITIIGATVESTKVYDGTADAQITNTGTPSENYDGKNLRVAEGSAAYDNKNVGNGKTVVFTGFALAGDAAANYKLTAQPENTTASISAKKLTIADLKVKDKQYDGKNTAEIDGTPTLVGVVDGDVLALVNGFPSFDSVKIGKNIPIGFTPFTLSGDSATVGNYTLTQPSGITANIVEYAADGSEYGVNSNDWINTDFVITAKPGYRLSLTDAADGEWSDTLSVSDETENGKLTFFVKNTETGVISAAVTEDYKIDKTVPTGEIKLIERTPLRKFINKITFSLFFKNDVNVKLTAKDNASGIKSVMYFKSDKILNDEEIRLITDWTDNSDFDIKAKDTERFVIYVRIEDNAGNVTLIASDGATFDTAAPEIVGVDNGKIYYVTESVTIDDANLESVTLNDEKVGKTFTLAGDTDATYVIRALDKAGNETKCTVTMKPISSITDAVLAITDDNVKSSDAETVTSVEKQLLAVIGTFADSNATENEKAKLTEAAEKCKNLNRRIAEIADKITRLTDAVNGYSLNKVTSSCKADIDKLTADIDTMLAGDNLTDAERAELAALKGMARVLLDRIAAAKDAAESDEITAVDGITKDNVKFADKEALEKAEKALEGALRDFDGNYTEDESKDLEAKLMAVRAALAAIGNAEKAAGEIGKLPSADDVKLGDKSELYRVKRLIAGLSGNERAMLGKDALSKIDALAAKIKKLEEEEEKNGSPKTGDTSNPALWIALLFISGGAVIGVTANNKKKRRSAK